MTTDLSHIFLEIFYTLVLTGSFKLILAHEDRFYGSSWIRPYKVNSDLLYLFAITCFIFSGNKIINMYQVLIKLGQFMISFPMFL